MTAPPSETPGRLRARRLDSAENLSEQAANVRRFLCRGLRFLMQRALKLSGVSLLRVLSSKLAAGNDAEDDRRQHHQQSLRLVGVEPAGLLDALLDSVTMAAKNPSEQSARSANIGWWTRLNELLDVLGSVRVRRHCLFDGLGALRLRRVPRHASKDHWQGGRYGALCRILVYAKLTTDLIHLRRTKVLLHGVDTSRATRLP